MVFNVLPVFDQPLMNCPLEIRRCERPVAQAVHNVLLSSRLVIFAILSVSPSVLRTSSFPRVLQQGADSGPVEGPRIPVRIFGRDLGGAVEIGLL